MLSYDKELCQYYFCLVDGTPLYGRVEIELGNYISKLANTHLLKYS